MYSLKKTKKLHNANAHNTRSKTPYKKLLNFNPIEKLVTKYKSKSRKSNNLNNIAYNQNYKHLFFYGDTELDDIKPIIEELLSFKVSKKEK